LPLITAFSTVAAAAPVTQLIALSRRDGEQNVAIPAGKGRGGG
jgi:hypothetical protein